VVLVDETGNEPSQYPLWPHPRYAQAYRDNFGGADFVEIDLATLLEGWPKYSNL
jgi:hypothetical protein